MRLPQMSRMRVPAPVRHLICFCLAAWASRGAEPAPNDGRLDVPAKVMKQGKLEYPEILTHDRERMFKGSAVLQFVVNEKGEVLNPRIGQVTHPAFVPPALDALFKTKFSPATSGGVPVASQFTYVFNFTVQLSIAGHIYEAGLDPFTLPKETPPECPPQYRYDTAPRPVIVCEPVYPRDLLLAGEKGDATILFIVDETGRVAESKVLAATKPEFGAAMRAAVEAWRFTPPYFEHRTTSTIVSRTQHFSPFTPDLESDDETGRVLRLVRAGGQKLVDASTLTGMPKLRYGPPPVYPTALEGRGAPGEAQVEFVIDRKGRVRLPRIISASHPLFGWAAVTAVQQWYYEPPQVTGHAVDLRVVLPVKFPAFTRPPK
jgi:TonB family protein